jgi:hypothetical protein
MRSLDLLGTAMLGLATLGVAPLAHAHHSYAMFDDGRTLEVTGTVAKLEWTNPHVYVWMYVKDPAAANGFTLYAFENGSVNVLQGKGWSRTALKAGDSATVAYWPLRDGRPGGHLSSMTLADGSVLKGVGGPRGLDGTLPPVQEPKK